MSAPSIPPAPAVPSFRLAMRSFALLFALTVSLTVPVGAQTFPDWAAPGNPQAERAAEAPAPKAATGPPNVPSDPTQVPIDGGLGVLALAGAAYAARKLRAQ